MDFLSKKRAYNDNVLPQYYVQGDHEAIISPDVFDKVQAEVERRSERYSHYSGVSIFSNRVRCGICGAWYGRKVWHSVDKYKKYVYQCNKKYFKKNQSAQCASPTLTKEQIKSAFVSALNKLVANRVAILKNIDLLLSEVRNVRVRKERAERLKHEVSNLNSRIENFDYTFYGKDKEGEYGKLILEFERTKKEYDALNKDIARAEAREEALRQFRTELADCNNVIDKFDDKLWYNLVDFLTVYSNTDIRVTFKDGTEIKA